MRDLNDAGYFDAMGTVNKDGAAIYKYLNFNQIEAYVGRFVLNTFVAHHVSAHKGLRPYLGSFISWPK